MCVQVLEAVQETLSSRDEFYSLAKARLGIDDELLQHYVEKGLSPWLIAAQTDPLAIPSPIVGSLLDIAREHGSEKLRGLIPPEPDIFGDADEYLKGYDKTRNTISEVTGEAPDPEIWPTIDSFQKIGVGYDYKGCANCR